MHTSIYTRNGDFVIEPEYVYLYKLAIYREPMLNVTKRSEIRCASGTRLVFHPMFLIST